MHAPYEPFGKRGGTSEGGPSDSTLQDENQSYLRCSAKAQLVTMISRQDKACKRTNSLQEDQEDHLGVASGRDRSRRMR